MRTIPALLVLLILAPACGPQLDSRVSLVADAEQTLRLRLEEAERESAVLQKQIDLIKKQQRTVHLVLKATGEDLGPWIDSTHAWNDQLGTSYLITGTSIQYVGAGCTGATYGFHAIGSNNDYAAGFVTHTIWRIDDTTPSDVTIQSYRPADESLPCITSAPRTLALSTAEDTGVPALPHKGDALIAELR
jgi:hypothetical protein